MAKIFDCFTFFNELEILDLRLKMLDKKVDYFVLVEATRTFQKKPKPLYFQENKDRFSHFHDRIIHVIVDTYPNFFSKFRIPRTWDFENSQREQIFRGLGNAKDDDIIIISDVDEIPDPEKLSLIDPSRVTVFEQYLSYYYLNYFALNSNDPNFSFQMWNGPVALRKNQITTIKKTRELRGKINHEIKLITQAGWHFSYIGGIDNVIQKLQSYSHKEHNTSEYTDRNKIQQAIENGSFSLNPDTKLKKVDIQKNQNLFPQELLNNLPLYKDLIKE